MIGAGPCACPCCAGTDPEVIGKLPDAHWFAGARVRQKLPGGSLFRCRQCRLKFRHPVRPASVYRALYDNAVTSAWQTEGPRNDWDLALRCISDLKPRGGRVLDFGCYAGELLAKLPPPYSRYGIEINQSVANLASERIHGPVWSSLDDVPDGLRFDVVIATDVIEHMINPLELLGHLGTVMTDDGILIVTTGDADAPLWNRFGANWWYCFYPEHLSFVSDAWLEYASSVAGWGVVRCERFRYGERGRFSRIFNGILAYCYGWLPGAYLPLASIAKRIAGRPPVSSVPGAGVSRDHLFIVLRKRERT